MRLQRETKCSVLDLHTLNFPPENLCPVNPKVSERFLGFKETATEYCTSSSLHGMQYMGRTGHYRRERWFWLMAILISAVSAFSLIVKMYLDYNQNPVETVFDSTPRRLQEIPFPAVTFCNLDNWLSEAAFVKYTRDVLEKPPEAVLSEHEIINLAKVFDMVELCKFGIPKPEMISVVPKLTPYFQAYKNQIELLSNNLQTIADESQGCQDFITACQFKFIDCIQHITGIVTDKGYCCVFNAVPLTQLAQFRNKTNTKQEHWAALDMPPLDYDDLLFSGKHNTDNWPLKQKARGQMEGLVVLLEYTAPPSICPREGLNRTYVYVTSQLDLPPLPESIVGTVEPWDWMEIKIKPDITLSDNTMKSLSKDKRKCYYENEFRLQWYKHYTQRNCIDECRQLDIMKECNCTTSYGVPFKGFCDSTSSKCHVEHGKTWKEAANLFTKCASCLPTCSEIEYHADYKKSQITQLPERIQLSQVVVNLDVNVVHPRLRRQSMTTIQLLSNAGGLLGLFMGFSVFSLLELFYYSTLCIRRARGGSSSTI